MKFKCKLVNTLLFIGLVSNQAFAWPVLNMDFDSDNSLVTNDLPNGGHKEPMRPTSNQLGPQWVAEGRPFFNDPNLNERIGFTVAPGTRYSVGIDSSCKTLPGTSDCVRDNALSIELKGSDFYSPDQDKAFFRPVPSSHPKSLYMSRNTPVIRYLSFDIKFDKHYELPKSGRTLHMQAYQGNGGPSMSLQVQPNSNVAKDIYLFMEYMKKGRNVTQQHPKNHPCSNIKLDRDTWYNLIIKLSPSFNKKSNGDELGEIGVYVNNRLRCYYRGNWGYYPKDNVDDRFQLDLGVYRGRSKREMGVYFDNIRYAPTLNMVKEGPSRID